MAIPKSADTHRKSAHWLVVYFLQQDTVGSEGGSFVAQVRERFIKRVAIGKNPGGAGGGIDDCDLLVVAWRDLVDSNRRRTNSRARWTEHGDVSAATRDQECSEKGGR